MKTSLLLFGLTAASAFTGYPVVTRDADSYAYVGFNNKLYSFNLPSLSVANTFVGDSSVTFSDPATASGRVVTTSTDQSSGTYTVNTATNTFNYVANAPQPEAQYPYYDATTQQTDAQGNVYTINFEGGQSTVIKTPKSGSPSVLPLPRVYNYKGIFTLQNGVLYLTATTSEYRGSTDFDYYAIDVSSFTIVDGPVTLPNSAISGCPVPARSCGVPVTDHISVVNGVLVYVYTMAYEGQPFSVTISSYTKSCGFSSNSFTDVSDPSPQGSGKCSSAPSTTSTGDNSDPDSTCTNGCAGGAKCCAGQCFSVGQYTCLTRTDGLKQLCPLGMQVCGTACYYPSSYTCASGQLGPHL